MDRMFKVAVAALVMSGGAAMAETVDLTYTGMAGGSSAARVWVGGQGLIQAGHMKHEFASGARAGQAFNSFCIDVREGAHMGTTSYQVIDLADAPMPGSPYGQAKADAVSAVVANAIALGWIDSNLQADASQAGYLGKMGAIQAAIWDALGHDIYDNWLFTSSSLNHYYDVLLDDDTFDASLRTRGLRALVASNQQDMLYIVPLPPAAMAGAGLLVIGAGVRGWRRR